VRNLFSLRRGFEHALLLCPLLHVEEDDVVVVEEVQAHLTELDLDDRSKSPRNLSVVKEARKCLKSHTPSLAKVTQHEAQAVGLTESLEESCTVAREVALPLKHVPVLVLEGFVEDLRCSLK